MAMTKQFTKTQWNNDREPAITAEQLNRMEKGIDDNDTRIVELDKAVTANKTAGDKSLAEVNKTLQKHTEDITAVNTELTSQGKAIGELADKKITKFYASSQGDSTLNDSDDGKMQDMMLYGKSEQKQYSGKQQFNINNVVSSKTNGLTISSIVENNLTMGISIVGTLSGNSAYLLVRSKADGFTLGKGKSYKLTGGAPGVNIRVREFGGDGTEITSHVDIGNGVTFTVSENTSACDMYIVVYGTDGQNENLKVYPMVTLSTETNDSYEPYVGGIPSPNPDYPQEIKSVVEPVVKVTGKNLLDLRSGKSGTGDGVTYTQNADGSYTMKGTATGISGNVFFLGGYYKQITDANTLFILEPGTYTIKDCVLFSSTVKFVSTITIHSRTSITGVRNPYMDTGSTYNTMIYPRVLAGNNDTGWEPYTAQSVPLTGITLNAIPVSSGGNVTIDGQQYISDYVDVERGKIVKWVYHYHLDSRLYAEVKRYYLTPYDTIAGVKRNVTYTQLCREFYDSGANTTGTQPHIYVPTPATTEVNIFYVGATPTEESLSEELAEKLKALQTYYPQTNLFITSNQLDGYAIFNYPISLANGWNYVKQQIGDTRDYIYDMDLQMAQAYVNSEYAVALTELEV